MPLELGPLIVILLYLCCIAIVIFVSPRLTSAPAAPVPLWKDVRFWATFIALVQIAIYALLG